MDFLQRFCAPSRTLRARPFIHHAHQVFLVDAGILTDELARHAPILRQHQQPHRIDIEPPRRRQPRRCGGVKRRPLGSSRQWVRGLMSATAG